MTGRLLEKVARVNKPIVVSTAGLRTDEIDWLVNFLETERADFALMHCVALYPTPDDKLQLNQIGRMIERYRGVPIGWSTHEDQNNTAAVQIAYAKGARLFERHVGLDDGRYKLNDYSSTPDAARSLDQGLPSGPRHARHRRARADLAGRAPDAERAEARHLCQARHCQGRDDQARAMSSSPCRCRTAR